MMNKILRSLLLTLLIVTPFLYASVAPGPLAFVEIVIIFMGFIWLLNMVAVRKVSFIKTGLFLPAVLFIGVVALQSIPLPHQIITAISSGSGDIYQRFSGGAALSNPISISICRDATVVALLKAISLAILFFVAIHILETRKQIKVVLYTLIALGVVISLFGIIQKYAYSNPCKVYWFDRECLEGLHFGPFVYRNNFAGYITMIIPLGLGFFLAEQDNARKIFYLVCTCIMSAGLMISLSRAGVIVFFAVLICVSVLGVLRQRSADRKYILVFLWGVPFLAAILFVADMTPLMARFQELLRLGEINRLGHGYLWVDVVRIFSGFPLFGTGLGTFGSISASYKSILLQYSYTHAHCDILQLLSETGIVGFVCMAWFFFVYFKEVVAVWLKRNDIFVVWMVLAGVASIMGGLLFALLDFNLQITANELLFVAVLALIYKLAFSEAEHALSA